MAIDGEKKTRERERLSTAVKEEGPRGPEDLARLNGWAETAEQEKKTARVGGGGKETRWINLATDISEKET